MNYSSTLKGVLLLDKEETEEVVNTGNQTVIGKILLRQPADQDDSNLNIEIAVTFLSHGTFYPPLDPRPGGETL